MGPQRVLDSCPRTFEGNCDLGMFHAAGAQLDDPGVKGLDDVAGLPTRIPDTPRAELEGTGLARRAGARYWLLPHRLEVDLQRRC